MKKLILLIFLMPFALIAQSQFSIETDYAIFPMNVNQASFELYYNVSKKGLAAITENDLEYLVGEMSVKILNNKSSQSIVNQRFEITVLKDEYAEKKGIIGVLRYYLDKGEYTVTVSGNNGSINSTFSKDFKITVQALDVNKLSISDIQLASNIIIEGADTNSIFYKNYYEVIANPNGVFGSDLPNLYYYHELYNVDKNIGSDKLYAEYILSDYNGNILEKRESEFSRENSSIVCVGKFVVNRFQTGIYNLKVTVSDKKNNYSVTSEKKVVFYNPEINDIATSDISMSTNLEDEFTFLSEDELDESFEKYSVIATPREKSNWDELETYNSKVEFLVDFWNKRQDNENKESAITKLEYDSRLETIAQRFEDEPNKEIWETDFGKVYLKYGEPDEIKSYEGTEEESTFQIWTYHKLSGDVIFVFEDKQGHEIYLLVHSTASGEKYDPEWQKKVLSLK